MTAPSDEPKVLHEWKWRWKRIHNVEVIELLRVVGDEEEFKEVQVKDRNTGEWKYETAPWVREQTLCELARLAALLAERDMEIERQRILLALRHVTIAALKVELEQAKERLALATNYIDRMTSLEHEP